MGIKDFFIILQIAIGGLIITLIMMQNRGSGLGSAFGGETAVFRSRRGTEKILMYGTVAVLILFFFLSLFLVWFRF